MHARSSAVSNWDLVCGKNTERRNRRMPLEIQVFHDFLKTLAGDYRKEDAAITVDFPSLSLCL